MNGLTMKLSTRFNISVLISTITVLLAGVGMIITTLHLQNIQSRHETIQKLTLDVFQLKLLTDDFLVQQTKRAYEQWFTTYHKISQNLHHQTIFLESKERYLLNELADLHETLQPIFSHLTEQIESLKENRQNNSQARLTVIEKRLKGQLFVQSQRMIEISQLLLRNSQTHISTVQRNENVAIMVAILTIAGLVITNSYFMRKNILFPIESLRQGTKWIAEGDLDHRVTVHRQDELGQLATAFNQMIISRQHAEKELKRSNKELDEFAFIASHDLKEPLRAINLQSSILLEDYRNHLDESGKAKLERLRILTEHMTHLIDSLFQYSQMDRKPLAIEEIDLNHTLNEVLEQLQNLIGAVEIRIPRSLPLIECDPTRVSQVFNKLISNAIKYNDNVEKCVEIGYQESPDEPHLPVFYVRDNGIGIHKEHLHDIFRIFKRLHGQDQFGGGIGAGLTFVKKNIERHGGKIWANSTFGRGTTFYFTLQKAISY